MSLPPSLLRIKRKAEDAPVDSLYVQDEQHASKRHVGDQYFFRRVVEDGEAFAGPRIPEVKTAGPSPSQMRNGSSNEEGAVQSPSLDRSLQSRALRRFLLSKGDMPVTATGKRRRGGRVDNETVAVLVEDSNNGQADRLTRSKKVHTALAAVDSMNDQTDNIRAASPRRRRPGGSAAIPRAKTDDSKVKIQDHKTTELHEALQRYARDASSEETHRRTKLADADQDLSVTDVAMHANDDMDYVYDTYIRYGGPHASSSMDTMAAAAEGSVGLLVLTQEDQELWHTYQEDDAESEADWDSEQDDENAENYYGADYPEDEVASDDEYGHGAYRYRKGHGSDEEYGSDDDDDDDDLSDAGDANRFPWKRLLHKKAARSDSDDARDDKDDDDGRTKEVNDNEEVIISAMQI